jgi:hypothetical protein
MTVSIRLRERCAEQLALDHDMLRAGLGQPAPLSMLQQPSNGKPVDCGRLPEQSLVNPYPDEASRPRNTNTELLIGYTIVCMPGIAVWRRFRRLQPLSKRYAIATPRHAACRSAVLSTGAPALTSMLMVLAKLGKAEQTIKTVTPRLSAA